MLQKKFGKVGDIATLLVGKSCLSESLPMYKDHLYDAPFLLNQWKLE